MINLGILIYFFSPPLGVRVNRASYAGIGVTRKRGGVWRGRSAIM